MKERFLREKNENPKFENWSSPMTKDDFERTPKSAKVHKAKTVANGRKRWCTFEKV